MNATALPAWKAPPNGRKDRLGMLCPKCAGDTCVIDTRTTKTGNAIRRRRVCFGCGQRLTTYETITDNPGPGADSDRLRKQAAELRAIAERIERILKPES